MNHTWHLFSSFHQRSSKPVPEKKLKNLETPKSNAAGWMDSQKAGKVRRGSDHDMECEYRGNELLRRFLRSVSFLWPQRRADDSTKEREDVRPSDCWRKHREGLRGLV